MYVDVHSHLYESPSPDETVREAEENGVKLILTAGEDPQTSRLCVDLSTRHDVVYAAVGIHPSRANQADLSSLEPLIGAEKVVAIGEVGLDSKYVRFGVSMEKQREVFVEMLRLAREYDLPVSVHTGRSYKEALELLFSHDVKAHLHWYSGSVSLALEAADSGYLFSFGPAILYYKNYHGLVESLPLKNITTETDYPVKIGGEDNHPARVREVVRRIAEIRGEKEEKVAKVVAENALAFFGVKL